MKKPKTVEFIKSAYQPTKREKEEEFTIRKPDGSTSTMEELAKAVIQPAKIRWIKKPRSRRSARSSTFVIIPFVNYLEVQIS